MQILETPFRVIYRRSPDVLWHTVGVDHEETLLIKEGSKERDGTRMFIVSGKTGAAIWSRLDGARTVGDIAEEIVVSRVTTKAKTRAIVAGFLHILKENDLVEKKALKHVPGSSELAETIDWPETVAAPSVEPVELSSLVIDGVVALASFLGGRSNVGGGGNCQVGPGGKSNITGHEPICHT